MPVQVHASVERHATGTNALEAPGSDALAPGRDPTTTKPSSVATMSSARAGPSKPLVTTSSHGPPSIELNTRGRRSTTLEPMATACPPRTTTSVR